MTSFKEVSRVRRKLGIKKAGHAGTLDQFASGLLLILTGRYTRLVEYFTGFDKVYRTTFEFGKETDTSDPEGSVTAESTVPLLSDIESVHLFSKTNKLVLYFRGDKYTVIVVKPEWYNELTKEILARNDKIRYDVSTTDENDIEGM